MMRNERETNEKRWETNEKRWGTKEKRMRNDAKRMRNDEKRWGTMTNDEERMRNDEERMRNDEERMRNDEEYDLSRMRTMRNDEERWGTNEKRWETKETRWGTMRNEWRLSMSWRGWFWRGWGGEERMRNKHPLNVSIQNTPKLTIIGFFIIAMLSSQYDKLLNVGGDILIRSVITFLVQYLVKRYVWPR